MLRILDLLDEFALLKASLAFHASLAEDLSQLLDPQLAEVLLFQLFGLDGELDGADFRVALGDALADLERRHAQREWLRDIALDGVDVVADLLLAGAEGLALVGTVLADGGLDLWLFAGGVLRHRGADVVHDLHTDCCAV